MKVTMEEQKLYDDFTVSVFQRGYEKGKEDATISYQKAYNEGHVDGYAKGVDARDSDIKSGYMNGYNKGLNNAWECARKILAEVVDGGFDSDTLKQIFGTPIISDVFKINLASEAIAKIKEYEEQQKQKLIANCITCKWDYRNYEKYLNVSEDEKVRHCNECYKNSGYELTSTEMKSCSILEDDCPYDIKCKECEVHCSVERAKQKLKGDKE